MDQWVPISMCTKMLHDVPALTPLLMRAFTRRYCIYFAFSPLSCIHNVVYCTYILVYAAKQNFKISTSLRQFT